MYVSVMVLTRDIDNANKQHSVSTQNDEPLSSHTITALETVLLFSAYFWNNTKGYVF